MRSFLICVLGASIANAFRTTTHDEASKSIFRSRTGGAEGTVSQLIRSSASFVSLTTSGSRPVSTGVSPSQDSINGTYFNPVRVPRKSLDTDLQLKPTSTGLHDSVIPDPEPTSTISYSLMASKPTPSPIELAPIVAPERNLSDPQHVVPNQQVSLDYAETGNTGMQSF